MNRLVIDSVYKEEQMPKYEIKQDSPEIIFGIGMRQKVVDSMVNFYARTKQDFFNIYHKKYIPKQNKILEIEAEIRELKGEVSDNYIEGLQKGLIIHQNIYNKYTEELVKLNYDKFLKLTEQAQQIENDFLMTKSPNLTDFDFDFSNVLNLSQVEIKFLNNFQNKYDDYYSKYPFEIENEEFLKAREQNEATLLKHWLFGQNIVLFIRRWFILGLLLGLPALIIVPSILYLILKK